MFAEILFLLIMLALSTRECLGLIVYVKSEEGATNCGYTQLPCLTFEEAADYIQRIEQVTELELIFFPGVHKATSVIINLHDTKEIYFLPMNNSVATVLYSHLHLNFSKSHDIILKSINFESIHHNSDTDSGEKVNDMGLRLISMANVVNITSCSFTNRHKAPSTLSIEANSIHIFNCLISTGEGMKISSSKHASLTTSTFKNNNGSTGGAIYIHDTPNVLLRDCLFFNNVAMFGGVLFLENTTVIVENSTFYNNTAAQNGGAIYLKEGNYSATSTEHHNNTAQFGGAIFVEKGSLVLFDSAIQSNKALNGGGSVFMKTGYMTCSSCFCKNNSAQYGGAIYIETANSTFLSRNSTFVGNMALAGGVIHAKQGSICLRGSNFTNNEADDTGGAFYLEYGDVKVWDSYFGKQRARKLGGVFYALSGSIHIAWSSFEHSASEQGAVFYSPHSAAFIISHSTFHQNTGHFGGVSYLFGNSITFLDSVFTQNNAHHGSVSFINRGSVEAIGCTYHLNNADDFGGVYYLAKGSVNVSHSTFTRNSATFGAVLYAQDPSSVIEITMCAFSINEASISGGAIFVFNAHTAHISCSNFSSNKADREGGSVALGTGSNSVVQIKRCRFESNCATKGGAIYSESANIDLYTTDFDDNVANCGGAIYVARQSQLVVHELMTFTNNTALRSGGAIFLSLTPFIIADKSTRLFFYNNEATNGTGGAVFFRDDSYTFVCYSSDTSGRSCLFNFKDRKNLFSHKIYSKGNVARLGSLIYGGLLYRCKYEVDGLSLNTLDVLENITQGSPSAYGTAISSEAVRVCHCVFGQPNCTRISVPVLVWRGEGFYINLAVLDQNHNTVSSTVISGLDDNSKGEIRSYEYTQHVNSQCTEASFHVSTESAQERLHIYANGPCKDADDNLKVVIDVELREGCPVGFQGKKCCGCDQRLLRFTNVCDIDNQILRISNFKHWINFQNSTFVYGRCPLDYCKEGTVEVSVHNPDEQCSQNKSGILCGACSRTFSRQLGTSVCTDCVGSKSYIWLIIIFITVGLLLAFSLLVCRLTVSIGTINGLIFYANVVSINKSFNLRPESHSIFGIFIDWLNFDFGIVTCFYEGLDTYEWVWLQYVFPLYIWSLVLSFIMATQKFSGVMKALGRNLIPVLTTLVLLSYTKLIKTISLSLSATAIYKSYNQNQEFVGRSWVWQLDGNINYLEGKHILLFAAGILMFVVFFLPYTSFLLFGQCLRKLPRKKGLLWVQGSTMNAVMDSYHAPYRNIHRYWTGLMLVFRCIILLTTIYEAEFLENVKINLMVTIVIVLAMLMFKWIVGSIYRNKFVDKLEDFFLFDLLLLTSLIYCLEDSTAKEIATDTSIGLAVLAFAVMLIYHTKLQFGRQICQAIQKRKRKVSVGNKGLCNNRNTKDLPLADGHTVAQTFITLREPLLGTV